MPFELAYSALVAYSPRGSSDISLKSRRLRDAVKAGDDKTLKRATEIIKNRERGADILEPFLNHQTVLVPAPRSSLQVEGGLWPSLKIAQALKDEGIITDIYPYLKRATAIPKSSYSAPGERPPVEVHVDSLEVTIEGQDLLPLQLTLIDDFVTKGTTLYACAVKLQETFPNATIRSFALVRTMGFEPDVRKIVDPCAGTITYNGHDTVRSHSHYE